MEKVREANAQLPKRWTTGRTVHTSQWTLGYDMTARGVASRWQTKPAAAGKAKNIQTG